MVCFVSNGTPLLWSVHVHMVFCSVPYPYEFFCRLTLHGQGLSLPMSKKCPREQNDPDTPPVLSARAHIFDVILETAVTCSSFCRQTVPTHQNRQSLAKSNECDVANGLELQCSFYIRSTDYS